MKFTRHKKNFLNNWWWTVDHMLLGAIVLIIGFSALMVATASPAVADRIGVESYYFIYRQLVYLGLSFITITLVSSFEVKNIRRFAIIGLLFCIIALIVVLFIGEEIKGSKRWVYIAGFSLQPSEFSKPFFAVVTGFILSLRFTVPNFPAFKVSMLLYAIMVTLLILQPDFGMVVTITCVWAGQLFLAGLPLMFVVLFSGTSAVGVTLAYFFLPHVTKRINSFLDPDSSENYQVKRSLEAFSSGGFFGKGPGEGTVKQVLPDSHTDFIFSVVGEEFGMITCLIVIALYAFIIFRGFSRIMNETDYFVSLAVAGLLMQFGMQSIVNMGVTLHLLPTKGMTLPFISYGGSSMLAISILVGMVLAMTRKKYGILNIRYNNIFIN